jgi:solute carrier family 25, member 44
MNAHGLSHGHQINPLGINPSLRKSELAFQIAREIFRRDGIFGYYRGYTASLLAYVPNSALWWAFYHFYQGKYFAIIFYNHEIYLFLIFTDELFKVLPANTSHLFIQCVAGSLGGFTTTIITNPLDIIRARLQVQRLNSFYRAAFELWREEKFQMFFKGLSARLVQSAAFSFSIILGYETIKRISVNDQYKHLVKW